ncbi:hypothetical protein EDB84DRAFT_1509967 [Lactarius hengduanensis]|nr:hypothetical protein EDB84DRAFT_1509967 [Lactarius hengduanensis]
MMHPCPLRLLLLLYRQQHAASLSPQRSPCDPAQEDGCLTIRERTKKKINIYEWSTDTQQQNRDSEDSSDDVASTIII